VAANTTDESDTIAFDIPGGSPHLIVVATALPALTKPVVIDGRTEPGFAGSPVIDLKNGTGDPSAVGLLVGAGSSSVLGLAVAGFGSGIRLAGSGETVGGDWLGWEPGAGAHPGSGNSIGIEIVPGSGGSVIGGTNVDARNVIANNGTGVAISGTGASANLVEGNYVGTDPSGGLALPNGVGIGITAGARANVVGGTDAAARNVIAGNSTDGVQLAGQGTAGNSVEGNYIGLTALGGTLGNHNDGVSVSDGAVGNTVGGGVSGAGNVISGNGFAGVGLTDGTTRDNVVAGNEIGTDTAGSDFRPNGTGVYVQGATGNTIGGSATAARNVISGNDSAGICICGGQTNLVEGNVIGGDASGLHPLPNRLGIALQFGAVRNTIGGTSAADRNLISGNQNEGVLLNAFNTPGSVSQNVIRGDYIGVDTTGAAALPNGFGVSLLNAADSNTLGGAAAGAGNVISGNLSDAVSLSGFGTNNNSILGNKIGTDATGTAAIGNFRGVAIANGAGNTTIGGVGPGAGNLISGNSFAGVQIGPADNGSSVVEGNYIGPDTTGAVAIGNGAFGIAVDTSHDDTIGGSKASARNVISGNASGFGIAVTNSNSTFIGRNYIGIDAAGSGALPNNTGVLVAVGSQNTSIGSTTAGAQNVISGNNGDGIAIRDPSTTLNTILGNLIGTDPTGAQPLGNAGNGIAFSGGAHNNRVGGPTTNEPNTIAFNGKNGVQVDGTQLPTNNDTITRNSIFSNGLLGIVLTNGGNHSQPAPTITSVTSSASTTTVTLSLTAALTSTYQIELFINTSCDPSGTGEGKTFLAAQALTTDGTGTGTTSINVPRQPTGRVLTATATSAGGDTSQFSACATAP